MGSNQQGIIDQLSAWLGVKQANAQPQDPTQVTVDKMLSTPPTDPAATPPFNEKNAKKAITATVTQLSGQKPPAKVVNKVVKDLKEKAESENKKPAPAPVDPRADIMAQMNALSLENESRAQGSIDDYQKQMDSYNNTAGRANVALDLSALAPLVDAWAGGAPVASQIAAATKDESPQDRKKVLSAMGVKLGEMKAGLSKSKFDSLKAQLDSYNDALKLKAANNRSDLEQKRFDRLEDKDTENYIQKLAKATEAKASMDANVAELNNALGFNVDDYDATTGSVNGKPVDLPGVSIPGVGRLSSYNEKARIIEDTIGRIFNTELKDRSGAAVTTQELERLKDEFSSGRFQSEKEKIGAVQRYKRLLLEQLNRQESAFKEDVRQKYQDRITDKASKMSGGSGAGKPMSAEEELKQLEAEGF